MIVKFSKFSGFSGRYCLAALFLFVAIGTIARLLFLFQPMRYDEAFSFTFFASQPLSVGLSNYSLPNNHLFHTLLMHLAYSVFGNQPWALRLPALVAGILLIPASYVVACAFYNKHAGLLTAAMVASSSILIEYSTNARGYTLVCFIFLVLLAMSAGLVRSVDVAPWTCFGVLAAIGFYTIPIMAYPYSIVGGWLFLSIFLENPKQIRGPLLRLLGISVAIMVVATLILYVPVIMSSGLQSVAKNRFVMPVSWFDFFQTIPSSLASVWEQWTRDIRPFISVVFLIGFLTSLVFHRRISTYRVPLILTAVIGLGFLLAIHRVVPKARVWLFLLPFFIVMSSAGLSYYLSMIKTEAISKTTFCIVTSLVFSIWPSFNVASNASILTSNETGTLRDAEAITIFLKDRLKTGDRILATTPSDAPLVYYFSYYGVPLHFFLRSSAGNKRLFVVVNTSEGQTLKDVLEKSRTSLVGIEAPRKLKTFESAVLYEARSIE